MHTPGRASRNSLQGSSGLAHTASQRMKPFFFLSFKMSFSGLRDKKPGPLSHGLGSSYPDLGQAPDEDSAPHYLLTAKKSRHFCDVGLAEGRPGALCLGWASLLCFQDTNSLPGQGLNSAKPTSSGDHLVFPPPPCIRHLGIKQLPDPLRPRTRE